MALKTKVKIGNISNLSDARYGAGMGVDFLGFRIRADTFAADLTRMREIAGWVSGPALVVEWYDGEISSEQLRALPMELVGLIEIAAADLEKWLAVPVPMIVMLEAAEWDKHREMLRQYSSAVRYVLLMSSVSGLPPLSSIRSVAAEFDVLLGSGVDESNVEELIALPVKGIALTGTAEDKPGLKEYASLAGILEKVNSEQ